MKARLIHLVAWIDDRILHHSIPFVCDIVWDWQLKYLPRPKALEDMAKKALEDFENGNVEDMQP